MSCGVGEADSQALNAGNAGARFTGRRAWHRFYHAQTFMPGNRSLRLASAAVGRLQVLSSLVA